MDPPGRLDMCYQYQDREDVRDELIAIERLGPTSESSDQVGTY